MNISHTHTLTRADIANALEKELGLSYSESAGLVTAIVEHIMKALSRGETVKLANFGVFSVRSKKRRIGRNPKTGEVVPIAARDVVRFKASSTFKQRIEAKNRDKVSI